MTAPLNPFAGDVGYYHDAVGRRAETLRAELAQLDNAQLTDIIDNGGDRCLQARLELAARRETAEKATRRAPLDARNAEIVEALHQPGALARTVAPNFAHLDGRRAGEPLSTAHVRRIHAEACGSPCPHAPRPPAAQGQPKPKRRRPLRVVQPDDDRYDPTLEEAEAAVTEARTDDDGWPYALPDDRLAIGDDEPIPDPPPPPDVLGVIYSDKRNVLAGEPACGKTWIALQCAVALIHLGQRVAWLDAEDSAAVFSERLARLGHRDITRSALLKRINHDSWIEADSLDRAAVSAWLANGPLGSGHLFIDSGTATESGISADDYAAWMQNHAVHVGMTTVEHVAKNPEQRFGPLGSTRKNAAATGITAMVEGAAWTPTKPASVNLRVIKDRPGGTTRQKGELYATVYGSPHPDGSVAITVKPPAEESAAYAPIIETVVRDEPGIGARDLRDRVATAAQITGLRSDWQTLTAEIKAAIVAGRITKTKGSGNRVHHHLPTPE